MPGSRKIKMNDGGGNNRMISAQRYAFILDILRDRGIASVQELSDRMGASFSTIRRDLDYLAKEGSIVRTRGGATLPNGGGASQIEVDLDDHGLSGASDAAKRAMALKAAERIEDGQSVIMSSGPIIEEVAQVLVASGRRFTAVTNNLKIAFIIGRSQHARLVVLGGTMRPGSFTMVGEPGQSFLERLHVDIALITAQSVSSGTITANSVEVASMKQAMIAAARRTIILADTWSFGGSAFCDVAPVDAIDEVIVASSLSERERAKLQAMDVVTTVVDVEA